jgi:IS4 transposase
MRVKTKFNTDFDKMPVGIHGYTMRNNGKDLALNIVKLKLPGGEIETLATNIKDKRMKIAAFKELYFMRWPIETKYAELKHKLEIENFSGRTEETIRQDYYITAFFSNIISVAVNEARPVVDEVREGAENKYDYHVNKNHAVGVFKDRFILALLESNAKKRKDSTTRILYLLTQHVTPKRPNRSKDRNPNPRKAHFHHNKKSNC